MQRTNERASEPTVAATATQGNAVMGSRCVCVVMPQSLPRLPHSSCCWLSLRFCCHCHRRLLLLVGEINYVANAKCSALCRQWADCQQQRVQREREGKDDTDALRLAFISLIGWHLPCRRRRRRRCFVLDCDWSATPTPTPSPTPTRSRE